jgi:hypothetical protein
MKYVKKEIGYALVDKFTHIVFVADLEKMNEDLLSSNI